MLDDIKTELSRVSATEVVVSLDSEFEPDAGTLVKIGLGEAYWHMMPEHFHTLLQEIPSGAGSEAVRHAIEAKGKHVWHGPAPEGSRDASP